MYTSSAQFNLSPLVSEMRGQPESARRGMWSWNAKKSNSRQLGFVLLNESEMAEPIGDEPN